MGESSINRDADVKDQPDLDSHPYTQSIFP